MKILKHDLIRAVASLGDKFDNSGFSLYQAEVLKTSKYIVFNSQGSKISNQAIVMGSSSQASLN